jgi:hypothetical protein
MYRSRLRYFRKHHGRCAELVYVSIIGLHQLVRVMGNLLMYARRPARRDELMFKIRRSGACLLWLFGLARQVSDADEKDGPERATRSDGRGTPGREVLGAETAVEDR